MAAPIENNFKPSQLGTKDYWDEAYKKEIEHFEMDGNIGEVWFGEQSMARVVRWLDRCPEVTTDQSLLDLGCGNGAMLIELASEGFMNLTGVDYSHLAIQLAESIAKKEGTQIKYEACDILFPRDSPSLQSQYDVVIDKGTYDAISLNPEEPIEKRSLYVQTVPKLVKDTGYFIITTCNWTRDEIVGHFEKYFIVHHHIPTPSFQFGGSTGNNVASIVFKKRCEENS